MVHFDEPGKGVLLSPVGPFVKKAFRGGKGAAIEFLARTPGLLGNPGTVGCLSPSICAGIIIRRAV